MNKMISGVNRHFFKASGHFRISEPRAFLDRVVRYCETYDLPVSMTQADRLAIKTNMGSVNMRPVSGAVSIHLSAPNDGALHMLRETVAFQIETLEPTCLAGLEWHDEIAQGRLPPNFRMARVVSVSALGRSFWRLIVEGDDLVPFAWDGMHLRLALPARGAPVQWPRLNERGRAVWPEPQDLHVAVYTIRDIDLSIGRLTIDIFRHEGGRTSDWAASAVPGDAIGLIGPGGGWFPSANHLVLAGDETALPAISRILENTGDYVTGTAIVEVAGALDFPLPNVPAGMSLHVLDRANGDRLEAALAQIDLGADGTRHIWVAAEKGRCAAIRGDLRDRRGVTRRESYVTGYWQKT
ncbi:Vibriobactin utilization protein ViuB [Rhodobacteraceae bacterium THAF1]|uniref:siderophore-interacting protein n=1 Tax=Palleronia sp. THAF1 TaxID=2587842 RepID=UPI000F3C7AE9|nr:siderophore-interacting protein [Palleronia sp. THAF1]QFU08751.1 Vibriobactin utilization protein ViuB [Palleronia sp. THAF1]VDC31269.1 Vibriobactin utilization protein ViuB [Rhodobacteraceae bacterium THAF1]